MGGAIIKATSNVPIKDGGAIPPRNAVYLFKAVGSAPNIVGFSDTPVASNTHPAPSSVYVQCFNHVDPSDQPSDQLDLKNATFIPARDPVTQYFYCGYDYQSNLGGKPGDSCKPNEQCGSIENDLNQFIKGKICDTTTSMLPKTSGPGIFGACSGLP